MEPPDSAAVEAMWEAYYPKLKKIVARKVSAIRSPLISESEIAGSAFRDFVQRAQEGKFDAVANEEELWRLLKQFAKFKANDHLKRFMAIKRSMDRKAIRQGDAEGRHGDNGPIGVDAHGVMNSPSHDIEVSDLFEDLMAKLPDDLHRDAVLLKLQGGTTATISECCGISLRRAQKLVKKIEERWTAALAE
jgi:hypothetical protein